MESIAHGKPVMSQRPDARPDARLDALPPELLAMIFEHLSDKCDLQSLRLMSPSLCAAATKPFCKFFEHRRHLISKHSLEALVEITKHPVFGPYVQSVSLGTAVLSSTNVAWFMGWMSNDCSDEELASDDMDSPVLRDYLGHQRFFESHKPVLLLKEAFINLKKISNRVTLGLFDDHLRAGYGSDQCYADFRNEEDYTLRGHSHPYKKPYYNARPPGLHSVLVLQKLRVAAKAAGCLIHGYLIKLDMAEMALDSNMWLFRSDEEGLQDTLLDALVESSDTMGHMCDLELHLDNFPYGIGDVTVQYMGSDRRLQLSNMHIGDALGRGTPCFDTRFLCKVAPWLKRQPLCHFEVCNAEVDLDELYSLIVAFKTSLIGVSLEDVVLSSERTGTQPELLRYLKRGLTLESLKLCNIIQYAIPRPTLHSHGRVQGREEVQVVLDGMIRDLEMMTSDD